MSIEARIAQYGAVFGDWHIGQLLGSGSGGRSAVFELYRNNNGWREYSALKVINLIEERGSQEALPQFRKSEYSTAVRVQRDHADQEVHLMEKLRGKTNIVDYLDHQFFDWSDPSGFGVDLLIRMEKLTDLRSELRRGRIFSEEETLKIGKDICQALVICHKKDILHRDIKPENIFFNSDGDYKLGDFGVSRIMSNTTSVMASTGIGTAAYSAPEQNSGSYDKRVDIYSLGLVLYELCNGNRLPFARSSYVTQQEIQIRLAGTELPPPGGNGTADPYSTAPAVTPLAQVILKACAFKPENRYQTAEEMLMALNKLPDLNATAPETDPYATAPADTSPYQTTPASSNNTEFTYFSNVASASQKVSVPTAGRVSDPGRGSQPQLKQLLPFILGAVALVALVLFLFLPGKAHEHVWTDATCTAPRTCEECGETKGEALGHTWTAGSCTAPRTCLTCGQTDGAALGHQWISATYDNPQTCAVCGQTQGTPLEQPDGIAHVSAGGWGSYALMRNGTVMSCGRDDDEMYDHGQFDISHWRNIVDISAGDSHVVGIRSDGTVVAAGWNEYGQCMVDSWRDIIQVSAGTYSTIGLRSDGTVIAVGRNDTSQCDVWSWTDIVQVSAGEFHTVALRRDGTVVATGLNDHGQCEVESWRNMIAVSAGVNHTIGLRSDGTVVMIGANDNGQCDGDGWMNIVAISAGDYYSVGLRRDGTVVAVGENTYGQCNVSHWRGIVEVSARWGHTLGLTESGEVVAVGWNKYGQYDFFGWQ